MNISLQRSAIGGQQRGFTLLEVVIAVAILGIAMLTIMEGISQSLNAVDSIRNTNTATELLTTKLAEMQQLTELEEGTEEGDFEETNPGYEWNTEVMLSGDQLDLYSVKITVTWTERGQPVSESIETYMYRASDEPRTLGDITRKVGETKRPSLQNR